MSEWPVKRLDDVCNLIGGGTPSKQKKEYYNGDIPWATIRDLSADIVSETEHKITSHAVKNSSTNIIPAGNVVVATRVGLGKICIVTQDTAINQDLRAAIPKSIDSLSVRYLFYWFKSIAHEIIAAGTGATVQGVKATFVKALPIPVPPLAEQERIVALLDRAFAAIDTATAHTQQKLQNAQELFQSTLQSFDYAERSMGALVNIKTGKLNSNAAVENGRYPFFTCSRETFQIDHYAFDCEAILLAGNNASGDFNVKHYKGKFNAYQRTYVISILDEMELDYRFLYHQLTKGLIELKRSAVGANTKFLKIGMLQDFKIPLPPLSQQRAIVAKLDALSTETRRLESLYQQQLTAYTELKQSLLHQAFSGEL